MHSYDEPVYLISVVAKVLDIHPQTLRQYEREGLINPSRTGGKIRLYSQRDIDQIKMVLRLTRDLGVNLAGVDIILRLRIKMEELERDRDDLRQEVSKANSRFSVPPEKSLITTKRMYDIIIFEED
ncbi:MAG: MerR family transcriptional regulator [Sulfuricurvum sp. PC08-66]|nr:MAG: MerR family transcriptional regulator [Sulfuricurvum sp. PC08-66]